MYFGLSIAQKTKKRCGRCTPTYLIIKLYKKQDSNVILAALSVCFELSAPTVSLLMSRHYVLYV